MIKFRCPRCQQKLGVPDNYAGHRVRCNKCNQPCMVPAPVEEPVEVVESVPAVDDSSAQPASGTIQDDEAARQEAIRLAAQDRARSSGRQTSRKGSGKSVRQKSDRLTLQEMIPDFLRIPLAVVFGFAASGLMVLGWVICSRSAEDALCFMALFVPIAAAGVFRLLVVERGVLIGLLCVAVGGLSIAGAKAALAQFVVIPYFENAANEEILADLASMLADEKLQLPPSQSIKPYAQDYDYMTCAGLVSLVEDGVADPVKARSWGVHIMVHSNKLNLIDFFDSVTGGGGGMVESEPIPDLTDADQAVMDHVYMRLGEWSENETELQMARRYYPAVAKIIQQAGILKTFKDEKLTYQMAFLNTLGLFDLVWIFLGLTIGYAVAVFD